MNKKFIILLLFLLFILSSCTNKSFELKTHEINYQKELSSCEFVNAIDGETISKDMIKDSTILVNNKKWVCPKLEQITLGKFKLLYQENNRKEYVEIEIVDLEAPLISLKETRIERYQNETLTIDNFFTVTDNYSATKKIKTVVSDFNLQNIGEQTIEITATDEFENTSTAKITLVVKAKEEEQPQAEDSGDSNPGGDYSNETPQKPTSPSTGGSETRYFMFSDGYNLQSGFSACQDFIGNNGSCSPVYDGSIATGYVGVRYY